MNVPTLSIQHLDAFVKEKQILFNISCEFKKGTVTVIMGPNGSGKSTFAHVIMGDPRYITPLEKNGNESSKIILDNKDILHISTEEKAQLGLFLSFQAPIAIPGVSVKDLLRAAYGNLKKNNKKSLIELNAMIESYARLFHIDASLLLRSIHEEFSGGERKKIELLQALVLQPEFAIFDEIDTGVDVDALKLISFGMKELQKNGTGIVIITHNERILQYIDVDMVLIMINGKIIKTGRKNLIEQINQKGYNSLL
jgi:Fe-S cluster assembly ATP-binding protein